MMTDLPQGWSAITQRSLVGSQPQVKKWLPDNVKKHIHGCRHPHVPGLRQGQQLRSLVLLVKLDQTCHSVHCPDLHLGGTVPY